jgi:hypothetical protein
MFTTPERSRLQGSGAPQGRDRRSVGSGPGQAAPLEALARQVRERQARAVLRAAGFHRQRRQRVR